MIWLTRITLDPRSREVQRDLADANGLHRTVMRGFPQMEGDDGGARAHYGVLHRVDATRSGTLHLLVQSGCEPSPWAETLPSGYALAPADDGGVSVREAGAVLEAVEPGAQFRFRLRANPTRRLGKSSEGSRLGPGARVGLRTLPEQLDWLDRKAAQHGFELPRTADGRPMVTDRERRRVFGKGRKLVFEGVTFEGHLRVTDPERVREAILGGIGSGKSYGFGLLTLASPWGA